MMNKRLLILFGMMLISFSAFSQTAAYSGFCDQGGVSAVTSGLSSTNRLQGIIPYCTVTVYLTGTLTKATIYKDSVNTPQTNPYRTLANGQITFYAATGQGYDIVKSGGISPLIYTTPLTVTDWIVGAGGGGSGCTPSGLAGDYLVDNGDGTCSPANANYTVGDFTTPNATNFGESNGLLIDTASCDATTCTLLAANTLDARKDVPIYMLSGFAASCLSDSGWVHVESITPTQIVIDETDTSCTGVVPSDTGGSIIYGYTDFIVNSAQHISLGGRYFASDALIPEPLSVLDGFFTKSTTDVTDPNVDASYSHINQEPTFLDLTTDQSEVKVSGSGYDSAPTGEVLLKTTSAVDGAVTSLDLLSDAESTLLVPRGIAISNTTGNTILGIDSSGNIVAPTLKSLSGTRFLCIDSAGVITSSTTACSGT